MSDYYTFTSSHEPDTMFPVGNTEVTITAKDPMGNSVQKSFTVTVIGKHNCICFVKEYAVIIAFFSRTDSTYLLTPISEKPRFFFSTPLLNSVQFDAFSYNK